MANKFFVVLILLLCFWITLEGSSTKKLRNKIEEEDSDKPSSAIKQKAEDTRKKISPNQAKSGKS
jgi:hypothetical protein